MIKKCSVKIALFATRQSGLLEEIAQSCAMCVRGHGGLDFESESQRIAALSGGNARLPAGADRVKERFDFEAQRFARGNLRLDEVEPGIGAG